MKEPDPELHLINLHLDQLMNQVFVAFHSLHASPITPTHPIMKEWVEEVYSRLEHKIESRQIKTIPPRDPMLVQSIAHLLKWEDLERGVLVDFLCDLLVDCIDETKEKVEEEGLDL